jgi:hypothetical protein
MTFNTWAAFYIPMAEPIEEPRCLQTRGSSCLVCQTIADAVTNWLSWPVGNSPNDHLKKVISLGDWEGFQRRVDCETCQQVVRYFELENRSTHLRSLSPSCPVGIVRLCDYLYISCVSFLYTIASSCLVPNRNTVYITNGKKAMTTQLCV